MASKTLIELAVKLGKQLGANTSKFLGTKSNVTFMGSGPKDGMLFQKSINPESFASIGIEKILPDIETSLGYAVGGKLNDLQMNKLIDNMSLMADMVDPLAAKNVIDASSKFGDGIASLRAKSGMAERQVTDAASGDSGQRFIKQGDPITAENFGTSQFAPGNASKIGLADESNLMQGLDTKLEALKQAKNQQVLGTVDRNDLPGKTARAREFLVNTLKVGDESPVTTLSDIIDPADMKAIMEGGGGTNGNPIVLVEKYFGPRIAEMIPVTGTTEDMAIFTKKILNNVEDASGLKPSEEGFDKMTAVIKEGFADGGRAGYYLGGMTKGLGALKATIKALAKERGMTGSEMLKVLNPKSLRAELQNIINSNPSKTFRDTTTPEDLMKQLDIDDMLAGRMSAVENYRDMMTSQQSFMKNINAGKETPARGLFEQLEKTIQSPVPKNVNDTDIAAIEQIIKNMSTKKRKLNATGGLAKILEI